MTGWRLGYIAGPKEIMPDINKLHGHMNSCATTFVQDAAITALTEEHDEVEKNGSCIPTAKRLSCTKLK